MSQTALYEKQKFTQLVIWVFAMIIGIVLVSDFIEHDKTITLVSLFEHRFWELLIPILIFLLFRLFKLETKINSEGISYRFYPIQIGYRLIDWEDIHKASIRKYKPIKEYGGWGIRVGLFGKGQAVTIKGNIGLQLELKNGHRLLIGTQKPEEIKRAFQKVGQSFLD